MKSATWSMDRRLARYIMINEPKVLLMLNYIETLPLSKKPEDYNKILIIPFDFKDKFINKICGNNKQTYYKTINKLVEYGFIRKVKKGMYIYDLDWFDPFTPKQRALFEKERMEYEARMIFAEASNDKESIKEKKEYMEKYKELKEQRDKLQAFIETLDEYA